MNAYADLNESEDMLDTPTRIGLTVQQMGGGDNNSEGVVIPAAWREELDLDTGDTVDAELNQEERTVTYHF
jgi:antitoxin component of MazEF toxin-antitoxin module